MKDNPTPGEVAFHIKFELEKLITLAQKYISLMHLLPEHTNVEKFQIAKTL